MTKPQNNPQAAHRQSIDVNADMGESAESLASGADAELMQFITSANIACGAHAGDDHTMRGTIELARRSNVAVGAHPGYPDRANFGRVEMKMDPHEIEASVREQIQRLGRIATALGVQLKHVKPHGALYHAANHDRETALAIGRGALSIDPRIILVGQAGAACLRVWRSQGLRAAGEAFADRAYEPDGTLRSRKLAGALIESPQEAARQAVQIAADQIVTIPGSGRLSVAAETICIHSDTPSAPAIARAVKLGLKAAGIEVRTL